jgi:hypothetical protein
MLVSVVQLFCGHQREVVEVLVGALVVEPVDPVEGLDLDVVDVAPRALAADEFVFERADGGLGQGVVQRVADRPDGGVDSGLDQTGGEGNTAYTALTYLLVRRAGDQTANLAQQLDVQRKSLEEARRQFETQLELTAKSTDAATAAVVEASRTRADEQAPRVVALLEAPNWPPNVDRTRSRMPNANETRLLDPMSKHSSSDTPGQEFYFNQDENQLLWLLTRGVLVNDGHGTARVRLWRRGSVHRRC